MHSIMPALCLSEQCYEFTKPDTELRLECHQLSTQEFDSSKHVCVLDMAGLTEHTGFYRVQLCRQAAAIMTQAAMRLQILPFCYDQGICFHLCMTAELCPGILHSSICLKGLAAAALPST